MRILGIETSCDETAAAVVENGRFILSNIVATSSGIHANTGGIIPEKAAREQIKSIVFVISQALNKAFANELSNNSYQSLFDYIDAIAITTGPGLIGSLLVGIESAKTLSLFFNKPIIPINHLEGHIYANWLVVTQNTNIPTSLKNINNMHHDTNVPQFPALALVVSGGHTDLVLMKGHGKLKWLGGTRDDAAGEAFDKTARLLSLTYPGGPSISTEAEKYLKKISTKKKTYLNLFPRPLIDTNDYDWSFSGLKTAVLRKLKEQESKKLNDLLSVPQLAAEIQEAIVNVLVEKSLKAIKEFRPKSFLLAGGVSANKRLREKFSLRIKSEKLQVFFHVPPAKLCTDNAAYIAGCAFYNYSPVDWKKINVNPQLTIIGEN